MIHEADIIAIKRTYATAGPDAALAEVRRRWPMIAENVVERTLERVLAAPVEPPASPPSTRGSNTRVMARTPSGQFKGKAGP